MIAAINFMILMAALGMSDSLRGIFAPAFQAHYGLSAFQLSLIIMVSYLGNLIFLCIGGSFLDRYDKRKVSMGILTIWILAVALYLVTDSFPCLLIGMFFTMGASTLLNTTISILTPLLFATSPGLMVNIFYFVQGIGTSGSQNVVGRFFSDMSSWKMVNLMLLLLGITSLLLFLFMEVPEDEKCFQQKKSTSYGTVIRQPGFLLLVLLFGFYFISEHGIMNWLVSYCVQSLGLEQASSSAYLSMFYGGIMLGRLIFAPVVQKLGAFHSIHVFGGVGMILFTVGILLGKHGLWVLGISGLAISILYPTLIFMIRSVFPENMLATAIGAVISAATVFDICFNIGFGSLIDRIGYRLSFLVLPLCMVLFYLCYLIFLKKEKAKNAIYKK